MQNKSIKERNMGNIYELDRELDFLESLDFDEETLNDTIEAKVEDEGLERLLDNIQWANINDKAQVKACDEQIRLLQEKKMSANNRVKRRNDFALKFLSRLKERKIRTDLFTVYVQKNPKSINYDESKIPDRFFKEVKQLDRDAIKESLKQGEEIEGVTVTQTEGIRFK